MVSPVKLKSVGGSVTSPAKSQQSPSSPAKAQQSLGASKSRRLRTTTNRAISQDVRDQPNVAFNIESALTSPRSAQPKEHTLQLAVSNKQLVVQSSTEARQVPRLPRNESAIVPSPAHASRKAVTGAVVPRPSSPDSPDKKNFGLILEGLALEGLTLSTEAKTPDAAVAALVRALDEAALVEEERDDEPWFAPLAPLHPSHMDFDAYCASKEKRSS